MFWKAFSLITIVASLVVTIGTRFAAYADNVFHYACKSGEDRYAITVNPDRGIVKMQDHGPPHTLTTFRIVKGVTPDCGRGGWKLSDGAVFCYATQGVGTLSWHGHDYDCDQADTE
jgi:hypothetical protein